MAAEERRRVGVATIADVLQARTAASQAQLNVQTTEGTLQTTRGALALALGLPANLLLRRGHQRGAGPGRPARRQRGRRSSPRRCGTVPTWRRPGPRPRPPRRRWARFARAQLPSLSFDATAGRTYATTIPDGANSYSLSLGLTIPIFNGFSRQYDVRGARFEAEAAGARAKSLRRAGRVPGIQLLLRAADRHPAGAHRPGPDRQRRAGERSGAGAVQAPGWARCSTCSRRRAPSRRPGPSGWTPGCPGASRWPSWPTTPACSTPAARHPLRLSTDTTTTGTPR